MRLALARRMFNQRSDVAGYTLRFATVKVSSLREGSGVGIPSVHPPQPLARPPQLSLRESCDWQIKF